MHCNSTKINYWKKLQTRGLSQCVRRTVIILYENPFSKRENSHFHNDRNIFFKQINGVLIILGIGGLKGVGRQLKLKVPR